MSAFGLKTAIQSRAGRSWRSGEEIVVSLVPDHARAAWSAKTRETLFVDGLRLARPVHPRWPLRRLRVACRYLCRRQPRTPARRGHLRGCPVARGHRRHRTTTLPHPGPVPPWTDVDVFIAADRAAWEEPSAAGTALGAPKVPDTEERRRCVEVVGQLAGLRKTTRARVSWCMAIFTARCCSRVPPHQVSPTSPPTGGRLPGRPVLPWSTRCREPTTASSSVGTRCRVAADVVARVDLPALGSCPASAFDSRGISGLAAHRRGGPHDALTTRSSSKSHRLEAVPARSGAGLSPGAPRPPSVGTPSARSSASWSSARCAPPAADALSTRCRQVVGVGAHDPADDTWAGKPCRAGDVTVGRNPSGRDLGDQCADPFHLGVGDLRCHPRRYPEQVANDSGGLGRAEPGRPCAGSRRRPG